MPWRDRAALTECRDRRLRTCVAHAAARVPYYRGLYRGLGGAVATIRGLEDLAALPLTDKAALRGQPEAALLADHARPRSLRRLQTTGSSGVPFVLYRSMVESWRLQLCWARAHRALGHRLGERIVRIMAMRTRPLPDGRGVRHLLRRAGLKTTDLDATEPQAALLARLAALRPAVIGGYPGMLARLGEQVAAAGAGRPAPRLLIAGGEVMTPARRRQIERSWGVPVREVYGCWEAGLLAWQCRATGLFHLCEDSVAIEILRDGRPVAEGERGELVLTALHCRTMPLIRYRLGDVVTRGPSPCPCGLPFATISAIQGRMLDFFRLPSGRLLHPYEILVRLQEEGWVSQYRLIQEREDLIRIELVPGSHFSPERLAAFQRRAAAVLRGEARLEARLVERIESAAGGKLHLARSLVEPPGPGADWHRSAPVG